jgi:hypothetical protein
MVTLMETTWGGIEDVLTMPSPEAERDDISRTSPRFIVTIVVAEVSVDEPPLPPQLIFTVSNASSAIINIFFIVFLY